MSPGTFPDREAQHTRRALLDILKREGPRDARTLSGKLGISPMAVRLHLYQLRDEELVTYVEEHRPMGRPGKLWRLTNAAARLFPDRHRDAAVHLLDAVKAAFGRQGLARVLALYGRAQAQRYLRRMRGGESLLLRLRALCAFRSDEDYMAAVEPSRDGGFMLVQNHCPISAAAASCGELCTAEQEIFQAVLGKSVAIERCEHIFAGADRCSYRISKRPMTKASPLSRPSILSGLIPRITQIPRACVLGSPAGPFQGPNLTPESSAILICLRFGFVISPGTVQQTAQSRSAHPDATRDWIAAARHRESTPSGPVFRLPYQLPFPCLGDRVVFGFAFVFGQSPTGCDPSPGPQAIDPPPQGATSGGVSSPPRDLPVS